MDGPLTTERSHPAPPSPPPPLRRPYTDDRRNRTSTLTRDVTSRRSLPAVDTDYIHIDYPDAFVLGIEGFVLTCNCVALAVQLRCETSQALGLVAVGGAAKAALSLGAILSLAIGMPHRAGCGYECDVTHHSWQIWPEREV